MINKIINEDNYTNSIREHLQIIGNILFDHNGCSNKQLNDISKAELIKAIDYLEKEKDCLSNSYKYEINSIIKAVRYKLSHITSS